MDRHRDAADFLIRARRNHAARPEAFPDAIRPTTAEQAYLIQREAIAQLGAIGGWKVGSPSAASDSFTCAPLPASLILESPADIAGSDRAVEAEIAVRLGADLPTRERPYDDAEIRAAVVSAHPAIEVLESRFSFGAADPLSALADSLANHSLVLGEPIQGWPNVDLGRETVRVLLDGREVKRGTGNPGGDMLRLLGWLANIGARWAGGLRAGQVVTTGSWTGKDVAGLGQEMQIQFEHCGVAAVRFR